MTLRSFYIGLVLSLILSALQTLIGSMVVADPPPLPMHLCGCCWVRVWEDENYRDDSDRICGPGKWPSLEKLPRVQNDDWGDEIESLKVGPCAMAIVWEEENFHGHFLTLGPHTERSQLDGEDESIDQINSMEITCE